MWKCKENAEGRRKIFLTHVRNRTKICLSGFGHYCGGLSFHAYSTIRALHLSKTAALHSAVCHHDGVYLHLRRGGRCFRVQLCGLRCLCCREPHYAVSHGVGCRVHHRRHCLSHACVPAAGRRRDHCRRRHQHRAGRSVRGGAAMGHPPRSKKGHGRHSLSCPFLCLLTARSRRPWGCRQPETRRCRCAWW